MITLTELKAASGRADGLSNACYEKLTADGRSRVLICRTMSPHTPPKNGDEKIVQAFLNASLDQADPGLPSQPNAATYKDHIDYYFFDSRCSPPDSILPKKRMRHTKQRNHSFTAPTPTPQIPKKVWKQQEAWMQECCNDMATSSIPFALYTTLTPGTMDLVWRVAKVMGKTEAGKVLAGKVLNELNSLIPDQPTTASDWP